MIALPGNERAMEYELGQQGAGGGPMAGEGLFSRLLERAIEVSLRRPGNHSVNIFTQILQSQPESDRCLNNAIVRLDYYEQNQIQIGIPEGWMLTAIQSRDDAPLLVCKVQTDVLPPMPTNNDNTFIAQCIGCGRQLESYPLFCEHFRLENQPREQILKYYCLFNAETKMIQAEGRLPIPWPTLPEPVKPEPPQTIPTFLDNSRDLLARLGDPSETRDSPVIPATIEELPNTVIVVPDSLLDQNARGGIAILTCTGTRLSLEDNRDAVIESELLERCFQIGHRSQASSSSPSRSILSRECMLLLTCLELSQMKGSHLVWSEQIAITFSKAVPEFQRQLDGNRGIIFPAMFMSIARILSATASDIHVITSEASIADAVTQSWQYIVGKTDRPKFIICIYEGHRKEFLIIATDHRMVAALKRLNASDANERIQISNEELNAICKMVQSKIPHLSAVKEDRSHLPQPSVIMDPRNFQTYFTDRYCKELIDTKLTDSVINKTYQCFNTQFNQLENYKEFRQMFIVPDRDHAEAENQNLQNLRNSEVHMLSVFKQAISGIVEEVLANTNTLWLFCLLGGNNSEYCPEFYQLLRPLADQSQTIIMMFSFCPYELYCSGSPYLPDCNVVNSTTDVEELANYEYGIEAHQNSLQTNTPSVHCSPAYENIYNYYMQKSTAHPDVIRLVALVEHCYIYALLNIESNAKTDNSDLITMEILRKVIKQKKMSILRVRNFQMAEMAYKLFNAAFAKHQFKIAKCAVVIAGSASIKISDASKLLLGQNAQWNPQHINDLIDMPCIVIYYGDVNGFSQFHFPLFSHVDARLMLNGYFTRKELEAEFILATSYTRRKRNLDFTGRTIAEIDAVQALQGMKRPVDDDQQHTPEKRIKIEDETPVDLQIVENVLDEDREDWKPTHVILSNEAYSVFEGSRGFSHMNLLPGPAATWQDDKLYLQPPEKDPHKCLEYYKKACTFSSVGGNALLPTSERRFLITVPVGVSQGRVSSEVANQINKQIRSQFSIRVEDDSELVVRSTMMASLALVRKEHAAFSPIMNTINVEGHEEYSRSRHEQFVEKDALATTIELDRKSITSSKVRKPVNQNSFNIWPLQLNIPQLCDGTNNQSQMIKVQIVIPNEKRSRFSFDSNGLKSVRLFQQDQQSQNIKTIIVSFGVSGPTEGLYDLSRTMEGTEYSHLIVVKHCHLEAYQECWPSSCLLVMNPEFNNYGIGCMKLFAQRLLQHSWALSPNDCWPFVFFLEDDVSQFREWTAHKQWTNISLHQLLASFERIPLDMAMVGLRGWSPAGTPPANAPESTERLVTGSYLLNLNNKVSMDHSKYEAEDIDFSLRQITSGNKCIVLERYSAMRKVIARESYPVLDLPGSPSDYIIPCHPTGEESHALDAPSYYLIDQYLMNQASTLFPSASANCPQYPVMVAGKYQNLTKDVPIEFWYDQSCGQGQYSGLILILTQPMSTLPSAQDLIRIRFLQGAKVMIIASDRNALRNALRSYELEQQWELSFLNEFQTNNSQPLYFLTGVKRQGNMI